VLIGRDTGARRSDASPHHERLHTLSGNQPLFSHDRKKALAINGEIYNHEDLKATVLPPPLSY